MTKAKRLKLIAKCVKKVNAERRMESKVKKQVLKSREKMNTLNVEC